MNPFAFLKSFDLCPCDSWILFFFLSQKISDCNVFFLLNNSTFPFKKNSIFLLKSARRQAQDINQQTSLMGFFQQTFLHICWGLGRLRGSLRDSSTSFASGFCHFTKEERRGKKNASISIHWSDKINLIGWFWVTEMWILTWNKWDILEFSAPSH